jgi:hypothetical protein
MALDANIAGLSGVKAEVDATNQLRVRLPDATVPASVGGLRIFSENDPGEITGTAELISPETDEDFRLRVAMDTPLDEETFNYAAQNTGKHNFANTTLANVWATGGLLFNSGSITTTTTGSRLRTYATMPLIDPGTISISSTVAFSAQPVANTIVDFGLFLDAGSNPFTPTDGVFFRLASTGLVGVINHNGTELTTSPLSFAYTAGRFYQFMIVAHERTVSFWIDNKLYATLVTPVGQGQPYASESLPFAMRHVITGGAAGGVFQSTLKNYSVCIGGLQFSDTMGEINNRMVGAYQGLSGGTMGTLASYANSADPTASAALSNTAALVTGLGGQFRFNAAASTVTDGVVTSFQVPAATVSTRNRRLKINGIRVDCVNTGAAVATTATTLQWSLAFGHTAVSLATAETATTKAPRRVPMGIMTWPVGAAIGAQPQFGPIDIQFDSPIYVNPGEFVALVAKFIIGTATASQVIWGTGTFIHSWE